MAFSLIVFVLGIQSFFLFRVFWEKAGNAYNTRNFDISAFSKITLSNMGNDRNLGADSLLSAPFAQAVACGISLVIALGPIIGRIQLGPLAFFAIFGAACYECNELLIWSWFVTDNAFGLRIILFGGVYGLITSLILGDK